MPALRSPTVNLCPTDASAWQAQGAGREQAAFSAPGVRSGSTVTLALSGPGTWKSAPRHVEPDHPYVLECDIRGKGRIGLAWVREGRPLREGQQSPPDARQVWASPEDGPQFGTLSAIGLLRSEETDAGDWRRVVVSGVSPTTANRVQVVLESLGDGKA